METVDRLYYGLYWDGGISETGIFKIKINPKLTAWIDTYITHVKHLSFQMQIRLGRTPQIEDCMWRTTSPHRRWCKIPLRVLIVSSAWCLNSTKHKDPWDKITDCRMHRSIYYKVYVNDGIQVSYKWDPLTHSCELLPVRSPGIFCLCSRITPPSLTPSDAVNLDNEIYQSIIHTHTHRWRALEVICQQCCGPFAQTVFAQLKKRTSEQWGQDVLEFLSH